MIIVTRVTANIDHAVDRRGTTKNLTARPEQATIVEIGLALSVIVPIGLGIIANQLTNTCGHMDHDALVPRTGFQQKDLVLGICR